MVGKFLNDGQGILAIAAGDQRVVVVLDEAFESRESIKARFESEYSSNLVNINKWLKYNKNSKTAIILSDYGSQGDGTELELTSISRCKN